MTAQCCANCTGAIKLETVIRSTCKSNRSFPMGQWREWLDTPFAENDCDHFAPLSAGELQRRAEVRAAKQRDRLCRRGLVPEVA